jgi:RNA polymerase sigma factor (sigma-70 family)
MAEERTNNETSVKELLLRLNSAGASEAWTQFLESYAATIMMVAGRYEQDRGRVTECFLYVCEKLWENDCKRLLQFNPDRGATFRTWLIAIVNNLCIDWHRMNYGRLRSPAAIKKLPAQDRLVYRYKFEQNLDLDTCLQLLHASYPQLERQQLSDSITRIHATLTSRQRWNLGLQKNRHLPGKGLADGEGRQEDEIVEPGPGPHRLAQQEQESDALLYAMSQLTPQQRLLLRLHYQENMPLRVVARVVGLTNLHQARRRIQAALEQLAHMLVSSD